MDKSNIERRNWEYRFKTNDFELHLYNSAAMFRSFSDEKIKRVLGNKPFSNEGTPDYTNASHFEKKEDCERCTTKKVRVRVKRK